MYSVSKECGKTYSVLSEFCELKVDDKEDKKVLLWSGDAYRLNIEIDLIFSHFEDGRLVFESDVGTLYIPASNIKNIERVVV